MTKLITGEAVREFSFHEELRKIIRGRVAIDVIRVATGKVEDHIKTDNMVVTQGLQHMIRLLAGSSVSDRYLSRMQFGAGDTAPALTDTTLETAYGSPIKNTSTAYVSGSAAATWTAYLQSADLNGFTIREAGLLCKGSSFSEGSTALFARATFATLTKSADFQFAFNWTITIAP